MTATRRTPTAQDAQLGMTALLLALAFLAWGLPLAILAWRAVL